MKKIVLAFSGGLDTSYCALYLAKELGYEVHTITVNTGGFDQKEIEEIDQQARRLGVASHRTVDETEPYYDKVIKYLIYGNILKNGTYPLSVSAERMSQALAIVGFAKQVNADAIAHGSTGAGNDQVRFDMTIRTLAPEMEIITPIRDQQLSREAEVAYLKDNQVAMDASSVTYSINQGLWGTSVGGKETLNSMGTLPEEAWPTPISRSDSEEIMLHFERGELVQINDQIYAHPVEAIKALQVIAGAFGIGRDIHVGDTVIGIKGRVGFEAAAPLLIIKSHHALEKHVLTKWQLNWKDQLGTFYGNWLHEGQYLDPVMRDIEAFLMRSQEHVSGKVSVILYPHRFQINGISSAYDLMSSKFGQYGEMNIGWDGDDVKGFTKIFANQSIIYHQVKSAAEKS